MSQLWTSVRLVCRLPWQQTAQLEKGLMLSRTQPFLESLLKSKGILQSTVASSLTSFRHERTYATYKPYPEFEPTPSPFKKRQPYRYGYQYKYFKGGLLPRPQGEFEDKAVKGLPVHDPRKCDNWTRKKALFGQNDYIDILGDGSIHPVELIEGPLWLRGFKGNEMQRLIRLLKFKGKFLKEAYPKKYLDIQKQIFYWHKKYNTQRRKAPFWGSSRRRNRIHDIDSTPR